MGEMTVNLGHVESVARATGKITGALLPTGNATTAGGMVTMPSSVPPRRP